MKRGLRAALEALLGGRKSIVRQTSLLYALISILVFAGMGFSIDRMLASELLEANDVLLLANMSLIRSRLARNGMPESDAASREFFEDAGVGYRRLGLAFLDEKRHLLRASATFVVPASALADKAIPLEAIPERADNAAERELHGRFGELSRQWVAPDGRWYQTLLARLPRESTAATGVPQAAYAALSYERSLPRDLLSRYRKGLIETLVLSVAAAAALGVWATHLVRSRVRRIAATTRRINAQALNERLAVDDVPEELLDGAVAFNQMLDRIEDAFRRLSEFSSDLAHDLRTPINNLLGEAQVALSRPRTAAEYRAVIESAVEEYERLSRMIESMLFLARSDDARARLAPRPIALRHTLENLLAYYGVLAEERNVRFVLEVSAEGDGEPHAWADELMLTRAVGNLLSNALRHGPRDCTITVRARAGADGSAEVEVSNPGPGIAREHLPRLFDRFYRPGEAREDSASGSGLGLAIVKSIAELHGGRVMVHSEPGLLTTFTLSLPAAA